MMNILDRIVSSKRIEVAEKKISKPISELEQDPFFNRPIYSLAESILEPRKTGIIAEFKRRSPSKGVINEIADIRSVTQAYYQHGASGISVLTDLEFFGGSAEDLRSARVQPLPILRKDFIIDEYQLFESRAMGADVILLIAACLTIKEVKDLSRRAVDLGLEVLLEIHSETELDHITPDTILVGVNNRNLKTFQVDIEKSLELVNRIPREKTRIAESGIRKVEDLYQFRKYGFDGFLIGENFMREADPAIAFAGFVKNFKSGSHEN